MDCLSVKPAFTDSVPIDNCVLLKPATMQGRSMGVGGPPVSLVNANDDDATIVSSTSNNISIDSIWEALSKANKTSTRKAQEEESEFNSTSIWTYSTNDKVDGCDGKSMHQTTNSFHSIHENNSKKQQQDVTFWNGVCTRILTQRRSSIVKRLSSSKENLHMDDTFSSSDTYNLENETTINTISDGFVKITNDEVLKVDPDSITTKKFAKNMKIEAICNNDTKESSPTTVARKKWATIPFRRTAETSTLSVPATSKLC